MITKVYYDHEYVFLNIYAFLASLQILSWERWSHDDIYIYLEKSQHHLRVKIFSELEELEDSYALVSDK